MGKFKTKVCGKENGYKNLCVRGNTNPPVALLLFKKKLNEAFFSHHLNIALHF